PLGRRYVRDRRRLLDGSFDCAPVLIRVFNVPLFYGIRGAGGNLGFATSFEYWLHPLEYAVEPEHQTVVDGRGRVGAEGRERAVRVHPARPEDQCLDETQSRKTGWRRLSAARLLDLVPGWADDVPTGAE